MPKDIEIFIYLWKLPEGHTLLGDVIFAMKFFSFFSAVYTTRYSKPPAREKQQFFPSFSKLEPTKKYKPLRGVQYTK